MSHKRQFEKCYREIQAFKEDVEALEKIMDDPSNCKDYGCGDDGCDICQDPDPDQIRDHAYNELQTAFANLSRAEMELSVVINRAILGIL
jgi:hypothetical protein